VILPSGCLQDIFLGGGINIICPKLHFTVLLEPLTFIYIYKRLRLIKKCTLDRPGLGENERGKSPGPGALKTLWKKATGLRLETYARKCLCMGRALV